MADDIRNRLAEVPEFKFTDAEWREYQSIPDQGYSHRHFIEHLVNKRLAAFPVLSQPEQAEEWEFGYASIEDANAERPTMRRRKAGPWLPVGEEESECRG